MRKCYNSGSTFVAIAAVVAVVVEARVAATVVVVVVVTTVATTVIVVVVVRVVAGTVLVVVVVSIQISEKESFIEKYFHKAACHRI